VTRVILSKFDPISQDESSEAFIGEWAEKRGIRDQLVIATKVILGFSMYVVDIETRLSILLVISEAKTTSRTKSITRVTTTNLSMCP